MNKSIELRTAAWHLPEQFPSAKNAMFSAAEALEAAESRAAELTAQLAAVTAELDAACNAAGIKRGEPLDEWIIAIRHDHADMVHKRDQLRSRFERTAPVDWRDAYQGETPLGIALDSMGDEVEP